MDKIEHQFNGTRAEVFVLLLSILAFALTGSGQVVKPQVVTVKSGRLQLKAMLFVPSGRGPFPGVLFSHGRGDQPQTEGRIEGITELGSLFVRHGYVFLAIFRRGEGLSADQGDFIGDLINKERESKGDESAKKLQLRLMETDHLSDTLSALKYLRKLDQVDNNDIAIVGHSFGGQISLLAGQRKSSIKAVVAFAAAANSWAGSDALRTRLLSAARKLSAPAAFIYAANDYSVEPGRILAGEMQRLGKSNKLVIYPEFGESTQNAHQFVYLGPKIWEKDVFAFLDKYLSP
jgi:carboxymethylenebutenolidase